jgi:single-stranded-DNA-specific exonuclease
MVKEMKKIISERYAEPPKIIVLGNPKWKPSLVGLAAGTLAEEHSCPVFIWGREGESTIKGSCRSDGSISLVEIMRKTKEGIFIDFGGHHLSGGFSVRSESVHILEEELLAAHGKIEKEGEDIGLPAPRNCLARQAGKIPVDAKMEIDEVNDETFGILEKLSPFGVGNEKPLFLFENIKIEEANKFGKENGHLKLIFKNSRGSRVPAIAFFADENSWSTPIKAGEKINMIANLEKSYFGNRPEIRLRIVDIF